MSETPDAPWTLEQLARDAAMSRSTLHERFVHFIGQPPMQYLAQWRMQVAAGLLRDTKAKLIEVTLGWGTKARPRSRGRSNAWWASHPVHGASGGGSKSSPCNQTPEPLLIEERDLVTLLAETLDLHQLEAGVASGGL